MTIAYDLEGLVGAQALDRHRAARETADVADAGNVRPLTSRKSEIEERTF